MLLCSVQLMSQSLKKANTQFNLKNYMAAAHLYEEVFPKIKDRDEITEVAYKVGECYRLVNKYYKANLWYKKAVDRRYKENDVHFKYATTLMMAGDYKLAEKMLKAYLATRPSPEMIELTKLKLESCKFIKTHENRANLFEIRNLQEINTKYGEFSPTTVKEKIVFTSSRFTRDSITYNITGEGFENFYETYFNHETQLFESPRLLPGTINSRVNNGTLVFDPNTNVGYFMQCNGLSGDDKNCNIYTTYYNEIENTWSKPVIFQHNSKEYSSGHPAISPDGKTLYYVSDRPGGLGGTDIWKTERTDFGASWSEPVNIGAPVNTPLNEMFPYMFDDAGLYFSSNGHVGYGGLDIYYAEWKDTVFDEPQNMYEPINSSADDFGIVFINGRSGMFTSNRTGGVGEDDIYFFNAKGYEIGAKGIVLDAETGKPVEHAIVVLTDHTGIADSVATDHEGVYMFNMLQQDMGYYVVSLKDDYLNPQKKSFTTEGIQQNIILSSATGYDLDFKITRIVEGKEYEIKDIYYDLDKFSLRPESIVELDTIISIMQNNPEICIQINSHTDVRASEEYNIVLSNNRAKSVVDYLISKSIDTKRLSWQGWGKTKLAIPNAQTEEEHQANRRTTFTIVNFAELHLGEKAVFHMQAVDNIKSKKEKIAASSEPKIEGVYFRLQIAATKKSCNSAAFEKIVNLYPSIETYCTQYPDGFYRYAVGYYMFLEQAEAMKEKIDALGYNSFIVAFKNGTRISIQQAMSEIQNNTDKD